MSSSYAPIDYSLHHANDLQDSNIQTSSTAPMHTENIGRFLMDQGRYSGGENMAHDPPPQLSSIGNTQFVDFSYPFQNMMKSSSMDGAGDAKMEHHSDPYNLPGMGSISERRDSIASAAGHASFTSTAPLVPGQDGSVEGSDGASPESSRGRGASMADGYGDEFRLNRGVAGDGSDFGSRTKEERDDPTPPWTELKTKAGKERKRLPLACIACRRKKIRCSGEKPACKHCLKSRIPCVYKVTTRKAAPRTDYMAMLDKRLKRMEERIIKIVPKEEHDPAAVTRAQVKPSVPGTTPLHNVAGKKRMAEEAFGPELDRWAKSDSKSDDTGIPSSFLVQEVEESRLLSEGAAALPSQEIQEHLAQVFFDYLYGQAYHLLHKPSFMRKLKAGTVPPVLILSVCALSARFSEHPKLKSTPAFLRGESWAAEARDIVIKRYEWPNITLLTCLLLLALHEFGTCNGGRSWALGGMAIQMAYTLQLHKDLDHDPFNTQGKTQLSFIDREIRRRTMWACFLMDRFSSSGTDRPMFMKEEVIEAQLPIKEKFFQLDIEGPTEDLQGNIPHPVSSDVGQLSDAKENMGVAAYIIRSIAIWGRIIIYLFQSSRESDNHSIWDQEAKYVDLDKEAQNFPRNLPDSLKYTPENLNTHETEGLSNQFVLLHISAQANILFLNHVAARGNVGGNPSKDAPRDFVVETTAKAFEAGKRISELLRDAESRSVNAPFGGYCAFLSSIVQMTAVFSRNSAVEAAAKKNVATNVRYLTKMRQYWCAFHWTSEHLKEQYRTCADAARQGPSAIALNHPDSIYQYGDWFNRYPHGVSQSDFEDPAKTVKKEKGDDAVLEQKSDYHTVEEFFSTLPLPPRGQERERERETSKAPKRKIAKKKEPVPPPQPDPGSSSDSANLVPGPPLQMSTADVHQITQAYYQMSTNNNATLYPQPIYYNPDLVFPPQPPGTFPQLDRQLVFGTYAGGTDASSLGEHHLLDNAGWDVSVSGTGFEPTCAYFVPINMEPPDMGQDGNVLNSLDGTGLAYGMGGITG